MFLKKFPENKQGRDFAVGDIHGCFSRLEAMLADLKFDETVDRVFCTGDLVDRGRESHKVVEWLSKPNRFSVSGNHEQIIIRQYQYSDLPIKELIACGCEWFLDLTEEEQDVIVERLMILPTLIEVQAGGQKYGIVHANVAWNDWDMTVEQLERARLEGLHTGLPNFLMWDRTRFDGGIEMMKTVKGVDMLIVGHNVVDYASLEANVLYLDTGAVFANQSSLADEIKRQNGEEVEKTDLGKFSIYDMTNQILYAEGEVNV